MAQEPPFRVVPYTFAELLSILKDWTDNTNLRLEARPHSKYFETYFAELGAETIVVEQRYIDNDFLQDYAGFYAQSFHSTGKECRRLHFFRVKFTENDLTRMLEGENATLVEQLQNPKNNSYLGFIVVKPLPETFVGRTCLQTYPKTKAGFPDVLRHFPIIRKYDASLFGLRLNVESLAFQEQDQSVAACATSALWAIFQGTGKLFQHAIPSPIEITRQATTGLPDYTRALPNDGLTLEQSAQAIRSVGLAPYWVDASQESNLYTLKSTIYAYAKGKVPLLLVGEIFSLSRNVALGLHAVAVTGFCYTKADPEPAPQTDFLLEASRLGKIYAHDDQVGPFARMEFKPAGHTSPDGKHTKDCLSTSFEDSSGAQTSAQFIPDCLLIPLAENIRIPFGTVHDLMVDFDKTFERIRTKQAALFKNIGFLQSRLKWDIFLTSINDFRDDILASSSMNSKDRQAILVQHLPLFMWRVTAFSGKNKLFDLLFDSTGSRQGDLLVSVVKYDKTFWAWLESSAKDLVTLPSTELAESWFLWKDIADGI